MKTILNKDKEGNDNINLKREIKFPKATKLKEIELSSSDKELSKSIANSLPKRSETNLKSFKDLIKSKTQKSIQKIKPMFYFRGYVIIFLMMLNHIIQEQMLIVLQREYLKLVYLFVLVMLVYIKILPYI